MIDAKCKIKETKRVGPSTALPEEICRFESDFGQIQQTTTQMSRWKRNSVSKLIVCFFRNLRLLVASKHTCLLQMSAAAIYKTSANMAIYQPYT